MNPERHQFLNLQQPPARLSAEETAWFMGFLPHKIPMLVAARLLKPIGNPPPNGCKYFASSKLARLKAEPVWLNRASDAIVKYWKMKNMRKECVA